MAHETPSPTREPDDGVAGVVAEHRLHLINIGYRLLGSRAEAEDAIQEAYARWYALSPGQRNAVESPVAWLTTVATRVCLDVLKSARHRRERYVGEWLPEPLPAPEDHSIASAGYGDPAETITLDESVSMAFLVMLDSMTPAERVAFVLHDVFGYPFAEIADMTGRTPQACRQLASSARHRLQDRRWPVAPPAQHANAVSQFRRAWQAGDIAGLVRLLTPDAIAIGDGGGRVPAESRPVEGAEEIASFFVERARSLTNVTVHERSVNGQPGLVAERDGAAIAVYAFDVTAEGIRRIWVVLNPDKLQSW